ncbi:hypothetical protein FACS1894208_11670 [Clostridia bacterium]|nr:hypothetical protein FACS1894208_11670 [Clostridia bacterium]
MKTLLKIGIAILALIVLIKLVPSTLTGLPMSNQPAPEVAPEKTFSANGTVITTFGEGRKMSRFIVDNKGNQNYYYITLKQIVGGNSVTLYVHPEKEVTADLPSGEYELYISYGTTWYGADLMFGNTGGYGKARENITAIENTEQTIIPEAINGNMKVDAVSRDKVKG